MTTVSIDTWRSMVQSLQLRNGAMEMTSLDHADNGHVASTFKVRLLSFDDQSITVEKPARAPMGEFAPGTHVHLLVVDQEVRLEAYSKIASHKHFQLNDRMRVMALQLTEPTRVQSAQRRKFFRVSLAGAQLEPVLMMPLAAGTHAQATAEQPVENASSFKNFEARAINISGGGMGVEAPQAVAKQLNQIKHYRTVMFLPNFDYPLEVNATVVHLAPQKDGTHYMGLVFDFVDRAEQQAVSDMIVKFTTALQRQSLQRQSQRR